jgi:hypothetical protein
MQKAALALSACRPARVSSEWRFGETMFENFEKKLRVEYLANGIWKQDHFRCTFVEFMQRLNELKATRAKIDLPHPHTGKWMHYILFKGSNGKWSVKVREEKIK